MVIDGFRLNIGLSRVGKVHISKTSWNLLFNEFEFEFEYRKL